MTDLRATTSAAVFGSGGDEPYMRALEESHSFVQLRSRGSAASEVIHLPLARYLGDASRGERELVAEIPGPVLDIGCGPGRMVAAAMGAGHRSLGIDVSPTAVHLAARRGVPVKRRSVFGPLPREGRWGTALLLDGNVGIGGDPSTLLRRCAELVVRGGWVVVEAHRDDARDVAIDGELVDAGGGISASFPWAEVGVTALDRHAAGAGMQLVRRWRLAADRVVVAYSAGGRSSVIG